MTPSGLAANNIRLSAWGKRTRLHLCPPGLFLFDGTLCFKSEYSTNDGEIEQWGGDAYVVESGEFFWGGAKGKRERGQLMVTPIRLVGY